MASRKRPDDFDLRAAVARAEFTPAGSDAPALVSLLLSSEDEVVKNATRALLRIPEKALVACRARLEVADVPEIVAIARALGRLPETRETLLSLLGHESSRARRAAASALGRVGGEGVEEALLDHLASAEPAEKRAIVEALGKVGSERSAKVIAELEVGEDAELERLATRATLILARDASRAEGGSIKSAATPSAPLAMDFACRIGLEPLLLDELLEIRGVREPKVRGRGVVSAMVGVGLDALASSRIATDLAFALPNVPFRAGDEAEAVARLLDSPVARSIFATYSEGSPRVRVEFPGEGPRRAFVWSVASALAARGIVNDSREASWEARVRLEGGVASARLVPRGRDDARFSYRVGDVPAASHPTIAAAIARLASVRDDDVVWDPFVGSGQELVERAKLGAYAKLVGTDLDPRALEVSRANLDAAELKAELVLADATKYSPSPRPTLIVSNPPMGRRVHRGDVSELLVNWLENVARVLAPDGRLVFVTPLPRATTPALERLEFRAERALTVDMGGFDARLERWVRD